MSVFLRFCRLLLLTGFWLSTVASFAQEVIEIKKSGSVEADDAALAKQQLMEQAIEEVTYEGVRGLIGDEKTDRSKTLIQNKIIKNSSKYVLSVKGGQLTRKAGSLHMETDLKISLKNLRALLLENGLLYQMDGPPKILPLIQVVDRVNGISYGWWYQKPLKEQQQLATRLSEFHKSLKQEFEKNGFFSLAPTESKLAQSIPDAFRTENLQRADYLFLGDYLKSSIVIRGQILVSSKPNSDNVFMVDVRWEALHSGNGRLLAEITRKYETDPGQFQTVVNKKLLEVAPRLSEDIGAQLSEAWKRGTFGASVYKLAVVGKIAPYQIEEFKKLVVLRMHDIKSMRDRFFEARKTTFEIDSSVLPQQLAQSFRVTKFNKYKVEVEDVTTEGLTIKVEPI